MYIVRVNSDEGRQEASVFGESGPGESDETAVLHAQGQGVGTEGLHSQLRTTNQRQQPTHQPGELLPVQRQYRYTTAGITRTTCSSLVSTSRPTQFALDDPVTLSFDLLTDCLPGLSWLTFVFMAQAIFLLEHGRAERSRYKLTDATLCYNAISAVLTPDGLLISLI